MSTTSANIQALIDSKVALIATLIAQINNFNLLLASVTSSPKPSYSIDNQSVSWTEYLAWLTDGMNKLVDQQMKEIEAVERLYHLQNIIQPYQFQVRSI